MDGGNDLSIRLSSAGADFYRCYVTHGFPFVMKNDPQDGFDLIEYPVDFPFKAMCKAIAGESAQAHLAQLVQPLLPSGALLSITGNTSRTGKFESVTLTVRLENRAELEAVYKVIANADRVVMTL